MKNRFLIGNFLPAYGQQFGRIKRAKSDAEGLARDVLADRFRSRAISYRTRRSEYVRGFQLGMVGALVLTIAAFNLEFQSSTDLDFTLADQELVAMEEIAQTTQIQKPPPPPPPPVPVEVPNDEILEDVELDLDASLDLDDVLTELPPPPPPVEEEEEYVEPEIFMVVEEMPELVGGMAALLSDLTYPELARKAGLEGVVVIQIVINEDGRASSPTIVKSIHEILDKEAVQAVMAQNYRPGKQRGRAVKVAMNIPVTFRLN